MPANQSSPHQHHETPHQNTTSVVRMKKGGKKFEVAARSSFISSTFSYLSVKCDLSRVNLNSLDDIHRFGSVLLKYCILRAIVFAGKA
jgi:hypothetical protein